MNCANYMLHIGLWKLSHLICELGGAGISTVRVEYLRYALRSKLEQIYSVVPMTVFLRIS